PLFVCLQVSLCFMFFFFTAPATAEIYTLSLHDALPILSVVEGMNRYMTDKFAGTILGVNTFRLRQFPDVQLGNVTDSMWRVWARSEEHTSELQSPCKLVCRLLLEKKKEQTSKT